MGSNKRVRVIVALAVVAIGTALALGTWQLGARGVDIPAVLTINGYFTGAVTANVPCQANRLIKVKQSLEDQVDPAVATTQTDAAGTFSLNVSPKTKGQFYTQVYPTRPDSYGYVGPNRCLGAKSTIKTLPKQKKRGRGIIPSIGRLIDR